MTAGSGGPLRVAVESSGSVGSVAVAAGGDVLGRVFLGERGAHAGTLVPALEEVLEEGGVRREAIEGVVVGGGPGSFTGVRVAAATAKGLAHALSVPLWPVSSLAAAAATDLALPPEVGAWNVPRDFAASTATSAAAPGRGVPRYVLFDARGDRVYAACFRFAPRFEVLVRPSATTVAEVLAGPLPDGACFMGDGALRHAGRIQDLGLPVLPAPAGVATADGLVWIVAAEGGPGPVNDPWRWEPDYLRASGAERARGR
jgi:tRNA threonylcarbamoyladenosine biosynthesis protein TsaB